MNGVILWEGISRLDRRTPIVAIATGLGRRSNNSKTGHMAQTWILRRDIAPHDAVRKGLDTPVCGTCPLRAGNGCYVTVHQAPLSVWKAYKRRSYRKASAADRAKLQGMAVRLGAYGDPVAVPIDIWRGVVGERWAGYTHQWKRAPEYKVLLMASVESDAGAQEAWAQGWRTFRLTAEPMRTPQEIPCPSARGVQCVDCGLCKGASKAAKSITIPAHGAKYARALRVVS